VYRRYLVPGHTLLIIKLIRLGLCDPSDTRCRNAHRIAALPRKPDGDFDAADRSSYVGQETVKQMSLSHTQKD